MPYVVAYSRAQDEADKAASTFVYRDERAFRIERSAARKTHNVIQETQGAAQRTILIVDLGVYVAAVSAGDQYGSRLVVVLSPAPDFNLGIHRMRRLGHVVERQHHKKPGMALEPLLDKRTCNHASFVHQQLRFDPMNSRRLLQRLNHV